jgi:malate dehydrogenase
MRQKITIIGAGKVGSSAAFNILGRSISDVVLVDIAQTTAFGEALDLMQAAPAIEFDGKVIGTCDLKEMSDSDLVIITAGYPRQLGMTRLDLAERNSVIVRSLVKEIVRYAPKCRIMMVTNPVDIMTMVAYRESDFERNRVFGMGNILDTLRFRSYISLALEVSREDVRALVIGEHGDSMVPLVHYASVSGIPITELLTEEKIAEIVDRTRCSGAQVIKFKGGTVYAPAVVIAIMAEAVLNDRKRVMGVSVPLEGEYGFSGISIGVPCVLGANGIERILELKLDSRTAEEFARSAAIMREALEKLDRNTFVP